MTTTKASAVHRSALTKMSWRLLPLLGAGYGMAYMDRVNISFASLRMNADLHFSATVYGLGGGLFFLTYALLEVPSNLALARVGARRWIAGIMVTWGLLAAGMMFVRTPMQFYAMRLLLGAAEAGFFPGVLFYLMRWFPTAHRGRAVSGFYVASPLSNVFMGAVAGFLLGLQGRLGLAGWQWLFLAEGLPAVALSLAFLRFLPESPATASWLTREEKAWIADGVAADHAAAAGQPDPGLKATLLSPLVIGMGFANLLALGGFYAFNLSAPAMLAHYTGLAVGPVGLLVAVGGLVGAAAMILVSRRSDRMGERHVHVAAPLIIEGVAFAVIALVHAPVVTVVAYLVAQAAASAAAAVIWLIPGDRLTGRSAAAGVAAIGTIGMMGAFLAPYGWGVLKTATGGYDAGVLALPVMFFTAAAIILWLRAEARRPAAEAAPERAPETAHVLPLAVQPAAAK